MRIPGLTMAVTADAVPWKGTSSPGVFWHPLHLGPKEAGPAQDSTVLIRMDPGCGYPGHRHLGIEEVLVLAGGYTDEMGEHTTGDYVRYPSGSAHHPIALGDPTQPTDTTNPACLLFAVAHGGIEALPTDPG